MNPFRKSPSPLRPLNKKDRTRWIQPESAWKKLEEYVENEVNVVIQGVEGSGKSTLLNWFFTGEFCCQAAEDNKLIFFADLSDTISGKELCDHLITRLKKAARQYLSEECVRILEESLENSAKGRKSEKLTFINACESLYENGYTMLLIMDGFERFVSSPNITQDQHDMLRGLLDKDVMRCVVATNYDLEKSSVPEDVAGSLYLQKFQDKIIMEGFTEDEANRFVASRMQDDTTVVFSDKLVQYLKMLTGRIPALYEQALSMAYDEMECGNQITVNDIRDKVYTALCHTMGRWCKLFKPEYDETIQYVISGMEGKNTYNHFFIPQSDDQKITVATRLRERGLWRNIQQNEFAFNSILLQRYFQNGGNRQQLQLHPQPLPQVPAPQLTSGYPLPGLEDLLPQEKQVKQIFIQGGVHVTNISNQQIVNNVMATRNLLNLLTSTDSNESFAKVLYARMTGSLPKQGLLGIERGAELTDAEYDQIYDEAFSAQVSDKIVDSLDVDQDSELVSITEEEQMTLDLRFQEARRRTSRSLSDEMLQKVSVRTAFYLKLSVVVEDALSILKLLRSSGQDPIDCSAQIILYGKAVEQQLKDSFYSLFRREQNLKLYQVKKPDSNWDSFENISEKDTTIGTYMHIIANKASYLGQLCAGNGMRYRNQTMTQQQWNCFWYDLKQLINEARNIRNLAAHTDPSECPDWEDIDRLTDISFGLDSGNIFECCAIGTDLGTVLFGNGPLDLFEGKALEGTQSVFCCTKVKTNGGMDGHLEANSSLVKISPSKAKKYRQSHPEVTIQVGQRYQILLQEYLEKDGALYFASDLLGPA